MLVDGGLLVGTGAVAGGRFVGKVTDFGPDRVRVPAHRGAVVPGAGHEGKAVAVGPGRDGRS